MAVSVLRPAITVAEGRLADYGPANRFEVPRRLSVPLHRTVRCRIRPGNASSLGPASALSVETSLRWAPVSPDGCASSSGKGPAHGRPVAERRSYLGPVHRRRHRTSDGGFRWTGRPDCVRRVARQRWQGYVDRITSVSFGVVVIAVSLSKEGLRHCLPPPRRSAILSK